MLYSVEFLPAAAKEFRKLQNDVKWRIGKIIDALAVQPRRRGCVKLKGMENIYRVRIGIYRMVYIIDDEAKLVTVTRIRHRGEVYRLGK